MSLVRIKKVLARIRMLTETCLVKSLMPKCGRDIEDEDFVSQVHFQMKGKVAMKDVTWCTGDRRAWSEDHAIAAYGNEPGSTTVYSAAAITVDVPPWSERAGY